MNIFQSIKVKRPKTSLFDLSHEKKLSCNMGDLIPIYLQEILPGDSFQCNAEIFMRLAPMISPVMHRVNVYTHFFFVPNRLVWDNWKTFITGGPDGTETPTFPFINFEDSIKTSFTPGSLADYMGIPVSDGTTTINQNLVASALPFRAYGMVYNEYYRDQNLETEIDFGTGDVVSSDERTRLLTLRKRCWEKDYFTSALPWLQRGDDVLLPIDASFTPQYDEQTLAESGIGSPMTGDIQAASGVVQAGGSDTIIKNLIDPQVIDTTSVTINELREAIKLQEWLEKNARGGARYIEQILSHFGVQSSDARLQRPEYLGGGKNPVVISEVLQTSETTENSPAGEMAGHGISIGKSNSFRKFFEEHGYIIGIMSTLPKSAYQQGVPKTYLKMDKLDYAWPEFANLGEQEIINKELYHSYASGPDNNGVFGYQSRYAEYKYGISSVHGDFKDTLQFWHMGRIFSSMPSLNSTFVSSQDITHEIFAVDDPDVHKLYCQIYLDVKAKRPLPYYGTPRI